MSQTRNILVANLAQNQTVYTDLEEFEYDIPNTSQYVSIVIDKNEAIDPTSFHKVITTAPSQLDGHIIIHGDGPLQPRDNPCQVIWDSCNSTTHSYRSFAGTPYLTYKILLKTFIGLKVILDDERRYFLAGYSIADLDQRIYGQTYAAGAAAMSMKTKK